MNKVNAPSILLEEFNYLFNKAINQYINKKYNIYDTNQQSTDDLRVLKSTAILTPKKCTSYGESGLSVVSKSSLHGATYEVDLPDDYLHLLDCVCTFYVNKTYKCYNKEDYVSFGATRLTADLWSKIINNFYMKPSYKRPYYYIHNVNTSPNLPTNPLTKDGNGTDVNKLTLTDAFKNFKEEKSLTSTTLVINSGVTTTVYKDSKNNVLVYNSKLKCFELVPNILQQINSGTIFFSGSNVVTIKDGVLYVNNDPKYTYYLLVTDSFLTINGASDIFGFPRTKETAIGEIDLVERQALHRYGNPSKVRMEIRYGKDSETVFQLAEVQVDYIKTPQFIRLTLQQIDTIEDTSLIMEYPDYICQEIINELTHLLMEISSELRLQTHIPITQSIVNPAQQLEPKK